MSKFRILGLMTLLLVLFSLPAISGKIYKWKDSEGRLHFSDTPPADRSEKSVDHLYDSAPPPPPVKKASPVSKTTLKEGAVESTADKADISIPFVSREGSASRVIIDVTFNGRVTAPMLLDTGSPGLILSASLANQLGLFKKDNSSLMVLVSGIGGSQKAIRTIVDEIKIGGITEKFIPTHIVSDMANAYEGLIGMDILSHYTLTIDSANKRLIANLNPDAKDLPGGRNRFWWETTFREFRWYKDLLNEHADLAIGNRYPYSKMVDSRREDYKNYLIFARGEADGLYQKLLNYARWNKVPQKWRD